MPSDDKDVWQAYTRGVKHIPPVKKKASVQSKSKTNKKPTAATKKIKSLPALAQKQSLRTSPASLKIHFTKKVERSLRDGTVHIDGRLDLHGLTQGEAFSALETFMNTQVKKGHRYLLIITGKGTSGQGVLRTHLPQWLSAIALAPFVLSLRPAALKHGGGGAFYVILKRLRD